MTTTKTNNEVSHTLAQIRDLVYSKHGHEPGVPDRLMEILAVMTLIKVFIERGEEGFLSLTSYAFDQAEDAMNKFTEKTANKHDETKHDIN